MDDPSNFVSGVEERLLVASARARTDPTANVIINQLLGLPIDWGKLFFLAARHRVRPLLFHALAAEQRPLIPDGADFDPCATSQPQARCEICS